jgi:predicted dehydrogenase
VEEALPLAANVTQPTMVACNWRFHPDVLDFLKKYVPVSDSGDVRMLHAWCTGDMASWPGMHYECAGWEGIHELDLALSMGDVEGLLPVKVVAASATHETFELVATVVGGPFISVDLNFHKQKVSRGIVAVCAGGGALRSEWSYKPSALDSMYLNQMKHFLECVREHKETCHSFLQATRAVRLTETALSMTGVGP